LASVSLLAAYGCGDNGGGGGGGGNPHLGDGGDAIDGPSISDAPVDSGQDTIVVQTCGPTGPGVTPLPMNGSVSGPAPIGASQFMGSCGGGSGGEVVYLVHVDVQLSSVTFTTDLAQTSYLPILYVRTTCDSASSEVGCSASTGTQKASVTVNNPQMGDYYVFIDSPSATQTGIYALTVRGTIPQGQACDPANGAFTCEPRHVCVERMPGQGMRCAIAHCADGIDNDNPPDGKIDFPNDPGCASYEDDDESDDCGISGPAGPNCPQCGNRIDDDGDGRIDYPADPGCSSASDNSEIDECITGVMVTEFNANGLVSGNTSGGTDHFQPVSGTCSFVTGNGPDLVYHYRVDQPTRQVVATMTAGSGFTEPILYVRKNMCGNQASQTSCGGPGGTVVTANASMLTTGDSLFFFADGGFTGNAGTFTIQLDVQLDVGATCMTGLAWKHCGSGLKCQNSMCVRTQCADMIDNDGDGKIDYPNDPGCTTPDDDSENSDTCMTNPTGPNCPQCGNGRDDDGDGLIDYPADPGCSSAADNDESDDCRNAAGMNAQIIDITPTGQADGTTSGASLFTPGCSTFSTAPEKVYEYRLTTPVSALIATTCTTMSETLDTVVYIRQMSCTGTELGCNDDYGSANPPAGTRCMGATSGLQSYVQTGPLQPGTYFIFVDGYSSNAGTFHLTVTTLP